MNIKVAAFTVSEKSSNTHGKNFCKELYTGIRLVNMSGKFESGFDNCYEYFQPCLYFSYFFFFSVKFSLMYIRYQLSHVPHSL